MEKNLQKQFKLSELAACSSIDCELSLRGDPDCLIKGVATLQHAQAEHITLLVSSSYKKYLATTKAGAVILSAEDAAECPCNALITSDPHFVYAKIAAFFLPQSLSENGIHPSAVIANDCVIASDVSIGAHCVIGKGVKIDKGVMIGPGSVIGEYCVVEEGTHLAANVTLYDRVQLGKRVIVASGTVIGSDGFGIVKHNNAWHKVPQLGRVIIGDDVEIGANCAIDRGKIEDTIIERGAKLDNLIQVGHNVRIGENTAIAGCVGIAGSAMIGKNCLIGGSAGISGHITIADNTVITARTVVSKSIREPGIYSSGVGGQMTHIEWRKNSARLRRLDQLNARIKNLESTLKKLTESD